MIEIQGQHAKAQILVNSWEDIDEETVKQLYNMCNHPAFNDSIRMMPDLHAGKGATIGFTMYLKDKIIPNIIGSDIACGMMAVRLPIKASELSLKDFDDFIINRIPMSTLNHPNSKIFKKYGFDENTELYKTMHKISEKINQKIDPVLNAGTLGGGNHFLEIDVTDNNEAWLIIHSGSRNIGYRVCEYHQKVAKNLKLSPTQSNLEYLLLDSAEGQDYIKDSQVCYFYSLHNKLIIASIIMCEFFKKEDWKWYWNKEDRMFLCVHNYIDLFSYLVRKGAISAKVDEKVIIPLSSSAGVIFAKGKGNSSWNYSAPHGAGRVMSRGKAKETISLEEYKESMQGIYCSSISNSTVDEAPQVYKDPQFILSMLDEVVYNIELLKPIYNIKGSE